jgi:hypothetical protein
MINKNSINHIFSTKNENQILSMINDSHDLLTFIKIFVHFKSDLYSVEEKLIISLKFNDYICFIFNNFFTDFYYLIFENEFNDTIIDKLI